LLFLAPAGIHKKQNNVFVLELLNLSTSHLFNFSTIFRGAPAAKASFQQINFLGGYPGGGMGADHRRLPGFRVVTFIREASEAAP
jgi:hypothetical protein